MSISRADSPGEYVFVEGENSDEALKSVGAGERLILRCDTGQRRFVLPPQPPETSAATATSVPTLTATQAPATDLADLTKVIPEFSGFRFFVSEDTGPRNAVPRQCGPASAPSSRDLKADEEVYVRGHFRGDNANCTNWMAVSSPRIPGEFWLPAAELLLCGPIEPEDIEAEFGTLDAKGLCARGEN